MFNNAYIWVGFGGVGGGEVIIVPQVIDLTIYLTCRSIFKISMLTLLHVVKCIHLGTMQLTPALHVLIVDERNDKIAKVVIAVVAHR